MEPMTLHGASSLDTLVSAADVDITPTVQRESNATVEHSAILDSDVRDGARAVPQLSPCRRTGYRRRIGELLVHRYERRSTFIDIEGLKPGQHFSEALQNAVRG